MPQDDEALAELSLGVDGECEDSVGAEAAIQIKTEALVEYLYAGDDDFDSATPLPEEEMDFDDVEVKHEIHFDESEEDAPEENDKQPKFMGTRKISYKCPYCPEIHNGFKSRDRHLKKYHPEHKPEKTNKRGRPPKSTETIVKDGRKVKQTYACPFCPEKLRGYINRTIHLRKVHPEHMPKTINRKKDGSKTAETVLEAESSDSEEPEIVENVSSKFNCECGEELMNMGLFIAHLKTHPPKDAESGDEDETPKRRSTRARKPPTDIYKPDLNKYLLHLETKDEEDSEGEIVEIKVEVDEDEEDQPIKETEKKVLMRKPEMSDFSSEESDSGGYDSDFVVDKFKCNSCPFKTNTKTGLNIHVMEYHRTGDDVQCPTCNKEFKWKKDLARHRREVHKEDEKTLMGNCPVCSRTMTEDRMRTHLVITHRPRNDKDVNLEYAKLDQKKSFLEEYTLQCPHPDCRRRFKHQESLDDHMKIHDGNELKCDDCERIFFHKAALISHVEGTHKKSKNIICPVYPCGIVVSSMVRLHFHVKRKHPEYDIGNLGEIEGLEEAEAEEAKKDVQCEECGKLVTKEYLKRHMLIHTTTQKAHVCQHCSRSFQRVAYLNSHIANRHPPEEVSCGFCSKKFKNKKGLESHVKKEHPTAGDAICDLCGSIFKGERQLKHHLTWHRKLGNEGPPKTANSTRKNKNKTVEENEESSGESGGGGSDTHEAIAVASSSTSAFQTPQGLPESHANVFSNQEVTYDINGQPVYWSQL